MLKFQAVAEKTAKKLYGSTFLPHPVYSAHITADNRKPEPQPFDVPIPKPIHSTKYEARLMEI